MSMAQKPLQKRRMRVSQAETRFTGPNRICYTTEQENTRQWEY